MPMKLIDLQNAVFTLDKRLQKRNGYAKLTTLPSGVFPTTLTTFNGNLTAIGNSIQSYNESNATWVNHGRYQPVQLSVLSLVRKSTAQTSPDSAVSGSLVLTVYVDSDGSNYYQVNDSITSQQLVPPTALPSTANQARAFVLGNNFVITFIATVSGAPHLRYISLPLATLSPSSPIDLSTQVKSLTAAYDGYVADMNLYLAWEGSDSGGAVRLCYLTANLAQSGIKTITSHDPTLLSVTSNGSVMYVTWYESSTNVYTASFNNILNPILSTTLLNTGSTLSHLTSAINGTNGLQVFEEVVHTYGFTPNAPSNYVQTLAVSAGGSVGSVITISRGVGLASKPFLIDNVVYVLTTYQGQYQPTYFLIDSTGAVVARLASGNGGGYLPTQVLPSVTVTGNVAQMAYEIKDLLAPVSKTAQSPAQTGNIYSQTGINLASFNLSNTNQITAEIGNNLNIAGGFLWAYDGTLLNEQGFHLWPEDITTTPTTGGSLANNTYYYQVTYEWTDAQGNLMRSAPSVPILATVASANNAVTLNIPTLRLTYKPKVRIVIYRWSASQQIYYQVTSITSPTLNNPAVDSITYTDTQADASIAGNLILYTTGGVVENLPGPATSSIGLYKSRLMLIPSEDQNLVWYSKQVLEATPVEMSDLFTIYAAPTISSQGSTGPTLAISAMDDKFIAFKRDAIYYLTGTGPDNTGASNDFSDPTFITSTVGCSNQQSIVFTPNGLVFQSDKGQWILGRGLDTAYIGFPVEKYNPLQVTSSVGIPGTNQIRMCLAPDLGVNRVLMYDYFFDRWGTFTNVGVVSSCIYQDLHTYLDQYGNVLQETLGLYVDNGSPVLMAFTTAWMNLMGLQGFQRAYLLYILGNYISPHTLGVTIAYDYNNGPVQNVTINPTNYAGTWGSEAYWGDGIWGGAGSLEQWRIFLSQQKMQAFQVTVTESYDPSKGVSPGAGLTFSGLNLVVGAKKGFVPLPASNSVG